MNNIDPRTAVIEKRLAKVKRIIAVTGWKGGIGKSVISTNLALIFAKKGLKTGLLDMDLTGASDHLILGAGGLIPEEKEGIVPPLAQGIKFMSAAFYSKDKALPLRGGGYVKCDTGIAGNNAVGRT